MMKAFELKPFENLYEGETVDGRIVRCNKDDFSSIAEECEEADIELTPDLALENGYPGFSVVEAENEPRQMGRPRFADLGKEVRQPHQVLLEPSLFEAIRVQARKQGVTVSAMMRALMLKALEA